MTAQPSLHFVLSLEIHTWCYGQRTDDSSKVVQLLLSSLPLILDIAMKR